MMSEQITYTPALKAQYNLSAGMFKEKRENHNYTILVHLALIDENGIETNKDFEINIESFEKGFYERLIGIIDSEIEQFKASRKNIVRIDWDDRKLFEYYTNFQGSARPKR